MPDGTETQPNPPFSVRARLFGRFACLASSGEEIDIPSQRARAILGMLCIAPGARIDRDLACSLLWPGRFEAQARASLRQCLFELKKQLSTVGAVLLETTRSQIRLSTNGVSSDLSDLERSLEEGAYRAAAQRLAAIGARTLLEDISFGDAFDEWLRDRRTEIERELDADLHSALAALEANGDMDVHAELLAAWRTRNPFAGVKATDRDGDRIKLAVLPFRSLGASPPRDHLADGFVETLMTRIARIPELLVAGRRSSLRFADADRAIPEIARELRVNHVIDGSVQRQGGAVCVSVRLIDGQTGFETWADQLKGSVDDAFELQEDLAETVVRALGARLGVAISPQTRPRPTAKKTAYDLYLQGRALTTRGVGEQVSENAVRLLESALRISPDFAEAWTALAEAHIAEIVYTPCEDRPGQTARMAECAQNAIAIDPSLGHARALLGIYEWTRNNVVAALDHSFDAYRLEPNNPDVTGRLGSCLQYCGYTARALPYLEAAAEQDPVHARNHSMLSMAYLNVGDLDASISTAERMVDLGFPPLWCAFARSVAGDRAAAIEQYSKAGPSLRTVIRPPPGQELSDQALDAYLMLAAKGVCSGVEEDRLTYCRLLDHLYTTYFDPYDLSIVQPAIWMGYEEMAFKTLGGRITPSNVVALMSLWADVEPISRIRKHDGFMAFAEKIGLVAVWNKYGWPDVLRRSAPAAR